MRAVFVTNQHKTAFYSAVATKMREVGVPVCWISVSERWTKFLIENGWPESDILSLPRFGAEWSAPMGWTEEDRARIARIEATAEAGFKNILIMDRELSNKPSAETQNYILVVVREIERFILSKGITHGFGEPTWAPEMLTSEVLRAHGRGYYMGHPIRVPSTRIGFYEGIFHDTLVETDSSTAAHREIARVAIKAVSERGERPYYFAKNMNPQRFRSHWLGEAALALSRGGEAKYDHTVPSLLTRSRRRLIARKRAADVRSAKLFAEPLIDARRPYVLVLLHKQPEASVDVFGNALSNQLEVIKALVRILPFDWEVWVKEHGHAIGDRPLTAYETLATLPGVRLIQPGADTFKLIAGAGLTASVAGTACMEAGIMGYPAITFARVFFAPVMVADAVNPFGMNQHDMNDLLDRAEAFRTDPSRARRVEDFITWCVAQSSDGLVSDPLSNPECMEPGNIGRVAEAICGLMRATVGGDPLQKKRSARRNAQNSAARPTEMAAS
jgi:hypothetical protein